MKIYLSGRITGLSLEEAYENFMQAEEKLKVQGHTIVNPMTKPGYNPEWTWEQHMVEDIQLLIDCDRIYMLDNWFESRGAKIEKHIAEIIGIPVMFQAAMQMSKKREERNRRILADVQDAIHEVTGLKVEDYSADSKKRDIYFCRLLYSNGCVRMGIQNKSLISRHLKKSSASVCRAIKKYNDEYRFNPAFREIAVEVEKRLKVT